MLEVTCPRCSRIHYADEVHSGKFLRCAGCGDAVQIGPTISANLPAVEGGAFDSNVASKQQNQRGVGRHWIFGKKSILASALVVVVIVISFVSLRRFAADQASDDATAANFGKSEISKHDAPKDIFDTLSHSSIPPVTETEANPSNSTHKDRSLPTGTRFKRDSSISGHGVLKVDNYSGVDAVVTVIVSSTEKPVRIVFVKAGESVELNNFTEGAYRVRFAMGTDWDGTAHDFTSSAGYYEFGKILFFTETRKNEGVEYSVHEITLNTDVAGKVPRVEISREKFLAGLSSTAL